MEDWCEKKANLVVDASVDELALDPASRRRLVRAVAAAAQRASLTLKAVALGQTTAAPAERHATWAYKTAEVRPAASIQLKALLDGRAAEKRPAALARWHVLAPDIVDAITGHSRKSVADSYGEFEMSALQRELEKIPSPGETESVPQVMKPTWQTPYPRSLGLPRAGMPRSGSSSPRATSVSAPRLNSSSAV